MLQNQGIIMNHQGIPRILKKLKFVISYSPYNPQILDLIKKQK